MSSVFIQMKLIKLLRYWVQLCPQVQIQSPSIRYNDTLIKRTSAFELWCWRGLLSPLDSKEIQPVHPKGNQSWILIGRTDAKAETPILWPSHVKNGLIWKDPDAGNDWRWEEKGTTEDEMVGWRHQLNGREFEQAPGVGDGQGSLACCSPWGRKESDTSKQLNWTEDCVHT